MSHQHLSHHAHHFHFCNIVVFTAEVVVAVAIVPGVAVAIDRNVLVWIILNCFPYSVHRHVAVVEFQPS